VFLDVPKRDWEIIDPQICQWIATEGKTWTALSAKLGIAETGLETHWRRQLSRTPEGKAAWDAYRHSATEVTVQPSPLAQRILRTARKEACSLFTLCDRLDSTPTQIRAALTELELAGSGIVLTGDTVAATTVPQMDATVAKIQWAGTSLRFCSLGDTHLGSKYAAEKELAQVYQECERRGISLVFHTGDLSDGERVYRGQEYEIKIHGADAQREYIIDTYPSVPGIETKIIAGNHDWSFHKTAGYDLVRSVAQARPDFSYYGPIGRSIDLVCKERHSKRFRVHLLHPRGGGSYARSYKLQKIAEGFQGGEKPDMALVGHWHHQCYLMVRNIHMVQVPCLQWQTPFEQELGLEPVVGAKFWEIEFSTNGSVGDVRMDLLTFYTPHKAAT